MYTEKLIRSLQMAIEHFATKPGANIDETIIESWYQCWPNTSCGFGGVSGQAFTTAPTVVIYSKTTRELDEVYYVYHNGRFAYSVFSNFPHNETNLINKYLDLRQFPGQRDAKKLFHPDNVELPS